MHVHPLSFYRPARVHETSNLIHNKTGPSELGPVRGGHFEIGGQGRDDDTHGRGKQGQDCCTNQYERDVRLEPHLQHYLPIRL